MSASTTEQFLKGIGKTAEQVRLFDWSATSLGPPALWPAPLKAAVNICLNSNFPIVVMWGKDLIRIYNDAYQKLAGNENQSIGIKAKDAWPDNWPMLKPMLDTVMKKGIASWSENQLLAIQRNGKAENRYFTFSYSPIFDEEGAVGGVFTTVTETTEAVNNVLQLSRLRDKQLSNLFQQAPMALCILRGPEHIVEVANTQMLELWGKSSEQVMNFPMFQGMPEASNQGFEQLLSHVYNTGERFVADELPLTLLRNGKEETIYVKFVYEAIREEDGTITGIMVLADDVSALVKNRKKIEESEYRYKLAIDASEIGTYDWDIIRSEFIYSDRLAKIFGYTDTRGLLQSSFSDRIHPDDRKLRLEAHEQAFKTGKLFYEARIVWPDDSIHWVRLNGKVQYNDNGLPVRMHGTALDITQQKIRYDEIRESEQRFRLMADTAPVMIWTSDANQYCDFFNKGWTDFTGQPSKALLGNGWSRNIHPDDHDSCIKRFDEAFKSRLPFKIEYRLKRHDGVYRWISDAATPRFLPDKTFIGFIGSAIEIHERKMAREELERIVEERTTTLKHSEERYHKMIDEVQDYAIILLNKDGTILNWNKGAENIKGYSEKEIVGKTFHTFYLDEDKKNGLPDALLAEARKKGRASHEGWRKRKDGTKFWGSIVITALHDEAGEVIGYSKVTRDLTDRKNTEDQLIKAAQYAEAQNKELEQYHRMVEEVEDYAIILLDKTGTILNWNKGAQNIKGYSEQEILGKSFHTFYLDEDRENRLPEKLLNEALINGKASHEGWRKRKDGTKFWGSIVITALHDEAGEVTGYSKVTRDLTEKKNQEDKIQEYARELENQNRELEQFAYIASHDLQEPLRKIQTFSEVLQKNLGDREASERFLNKIHSSAQRMSELIKSVLTYSRLARSENKFVDVDLNHILEQIMVDYELLISEKNAVIEHDDLPVIKGVPLQLSQLFSNLLGNSLKFSEKEPLITIKARMLSAGEAGHESLEDNYSYVELVFQDNGIGFEQKYASQIFTIFQRLHSSQSYSGTGIGLAICKKIVDNHHGLIYARSELGKGATFYIYLPVH